jgi:survival-of-motor-neuron-related-splicing factor 30
MLGGAEAIDNAIVDPLLDAEQEANLTRLALKKKIEDAADVDVISRDLPPKLRIKPDDSEDVVSATYLNNHVAFEVRL